MGTMRRIKDSINFWLRIVLTYTFRPFFRLFSRDITDVLPRGTALVFAPHPDDETLGCGATVARLAAGGRRVRIVCATDGGKASISRVISPARLAAIRREELPRAAARLGVRPYDVVMLNYPDGEADEHVDKLTRAFAGQIKTAAPELVLMPSPLEWSKDHRVVARACAAAMRQAGYKGMALEYQVWFMPLGLLDLLAFWRLLRYRKVRAGEHLAAKRAAMAEHRSQVENLTGEPEWFMFDERYLSLFMRPEEIFYERRGL